MNQDRIISPSVDEDLLDSVRLERLEQAFRKFAAGPVRRGRACAPGASEIVSNHKAATCVVDHASRPSYVGASASRKRILLIFLLIRYTGAKLSEVLELDPARDIDLAQLTVCYGGTGESRREAQISESLAHDLALLLAEGEEEKFFAVDPAYVRRKFYERAEECGFAKNLGGPEMIRKARAVELLRNDMPLPAVQHLLGHSTPNLTTSYVSFSKEDMGELTKLYMDRESGRKTSARNSFFCKVRALAKGEVQTLVELTATDGEPLSTIITNTSAERLGLKPGMLITAEVKAPWLIMERSDRPGLSSAENSREGVIVRIIRGKINTECALRASDGTELCAVLSTAGFDALGLATDDTARMIFSSYAVILHKN